MWKYKSVFRFGHLFRSTCGIHFFTKLSVLIKTSICQIRYTSTYVINIENFQILNCARIQYSAKKISHWAGYFDLYREKYKTDVMALFYKNVAFKKRFQKRIILVATKEWFSSMQIRHSL